MFNTTLELRTVYTLLTEMDNNRIDLDPIYQRGYIWNEQKKSDFIDSVMKGVIPSNIVLNQRYSSKKGMVITCIDGKQRLTSIYDFYRNIIPWIVIDDEDNETHFYHSKLPNLKKDNVKYELLDEKSIQKQFLDRKIPVAVYSDVDYVSQVDIFSRINKGMPVTYDDKIISKFKNEKSGLLIKKLFEEIKFQNSYIYETLFLIYNDDVIPLTPSKERKFIKKNNNVVCLTELIDKSKDFLKLYYSNKIINHNDIKILKIKKFVKILLCYLSYLLDLKNNKDNIVCQQLDKWINNNDIKTLSVRSAYNTGKTTMIKHVFKKYNPNRVLFVSHRVSFTNNLQGVFKDYNVCSYLDNDLYEDRVICQIESLKKLINFNYFEQEMVIPSFDLIILDEIESLINHFSSPTIKDVNRTFDIFQGIVHNSDKILALDGDFGNRAYTFLKHFGKNIIINNKCQKDKRHYMFMDSKRDFDKMINNDLKNGKNIVVASMSSKKANEIHNKYVKKYKSVLHCSKSDDKLKESLKDVEKFWNKYPDPILIFFDPNEEI